MYGVILNLYKNVAICPAVYVGCINRGGNCPTPQYPVAGRETEYRHVQENSGQTADYPTRPARPNGKEMRISYMNRQGESGDFLLFGPRAFTVKKNVPLTGNVTQLVTSAKGWLSKRMSASGNGCTFSYVWACQVSGSGNPLKKTVQKEEVMLFCRRSH